MKRKWILVAALLLSIAMATTGTLAYLTSTDEAVNVMTLGNVKIEQLENGQPNDGFNQGQPLYPAYIVPGEGENPDIVKGIVEKKITVKNIGKSDAYVRTAIAFEAGEMTTLSDFHALIHAEFGFATADVHWLENPVTIGKDGEQQNYFIAWVVYPEALPAGTTTTIPSLVSVYMKPEATNDQMEQFGGTYEILAVSQAVQTANFDNVDVAEFSARNVINESLARAMFALDTSFGEVTEIDHPWVDVDVIVPDMIHVYTDTTAVRGKDGSYTVGSNFEASDIIHFGSGTVVDLALNNKTITAGKPSQYLWGAQNGAILHLTGNGTINAGKGFLATKENAQIIIDGGSYHMTQTGTLNNIKHTSLAQNNSKIIINGGTFTTNVDNACLFFATSNATIEVNGGFFENIADKTPDLFSMGTNKSNTNRIIFKAGTFVNWNPLEDRMCYTGEWPANYERFSGPWMLVWDGYTVVSETQENGDVWYTVVPVSK